MNPDLGKKVIFSWLRFMEKEAQIQAVYINHNTLLLSNVCAFVAIKLKIPILIKTLIIITHWYVVKDINLRRNFAMIRNKFNLANVDYSIKL
jgi:hypothetical protein